MPALFLSPTPPLPPPSYFGNEGRRRERLAGASHRIPQAWVGSAVNAVSGEDGMPSTAPTECAGEFELSPF